MYKGSWTKAKNISKEKEKVKTKIEKHLDKYPAQAPWSCNTAWTLWDELSVISLSSLQE